MIRRSPAFLGLLGLLLASPWGLSAATLHGDGDPRLLARVGSETITEQEISSDVDQFMSQIAPQKLKQIPDGDVAAFRKKLAEVRLNHWIDVKLLLQEARAQLPAAEMERAQGSIAAEFENKELPRILVQQKVKSRDELELQMAKWRTSVAERKRAYVEQQVAFGWLSQQVKQPKESTKDNRKLAMKNYLARLKDRYPVKVE